VFADFEHRTEVRMIEPRRGAGLAQYSPLRVCAAKMIDAQELDPDLAAKPSIGREVDFSHPAFAKTADKPVLLYLRWKLADRLGSISIPRD
jgi:hypothetical protein